MATHDCLGFRGLGSKGGLGFRGSRVRFLGLGFWVYVFLVLPVLGLGFRRWAANNSQIKRNCLEGQGDSLSLHLNPP